MAGSADGECVGGAFRGAENHQGNESQVSFLQSHDWLEALVDEISPLI